MDKDPIQAEFDETLVELTSMFDLVGGFKDSFDAGQLRRYKAICMWYQRFQAKQARDRQALDMLKSKASTPEKALECMGRFRALLEKHQEQLGIVTSQLTELLRSSLRGSRRNKPHSTGP